jgi:hypothetical protein
MKKHRFKKKEKSDTNLTHVRRLPQSVECLKRRIRKKNWSFHPQ